MEEHFYWKRFIVWLTFLGNNINYIYIYNYSLLDNLEQIWTCGHVKLLEIIHFSIKVSIS